jgi:prepilin peptidase CpaA
LVSPWVEMAARGSGPGALALPLGLSLWMAWEDLKARRIPNYLTGGAALAGLVFQGACCGWPGLADGFLGLALGFGLLIVPYRFGVMGAGDVKALAALGAWLGPPGTFRLFVYMTLAGGLMALASLWWHGCLWSACRRLWALLLNLGLTWGLKPEPETAPAGQYGLPYGAAMAAGMLGLVVF